MTDTPAHIVRMQSEHVELADRIAKLRAFTLGPVFQKLEDIDRALLITQVCAMEAYEGALLLRLKRAVSA